MVGYSGAIFCCKFFSDWHAMNHVREERGLPGMSGYPFSIVDRSDASPNNPLEQTFFVKASTPKSRINGVAVTLRNEGAGLYDIDQFEEAIMRGLSAAMSGREFILDSVVVYDCLPIVEPE